MLKTLYSYRHYLFGSVWADFRYQYAGTALGFFWFILNPIFEVLIYTVVFSHIQGFRSPDRETPYVLFLVTGLFPWLSFTEAILKGTNALTKNASYLRRMSVPTVIFVGKNSLLASFTLVIYLLILLVYFMIAGGALSASLLALPLLAILLQLSAFGITLVTAHLRVIFPDIGEILPTLLHLWRWLLPIIYPATIFPEALRQILKFNPPYYFIESFRGAFLDGEFPGPEAWWHMLVWTAIFLIAGLFTASKLHSDVIDEL